VSIVPIWEYDEIETGTDDSPAEFEGSGTGMDGAATSAGSAAVLISST